MRYEMEMDVASMIWIEVKKKVVEGLVERKV